MFLAEKGSAQPRTLANAFLRPTSVRPDLQANAYHALAAHLADLDRAYGRNQRRFLAVSDADRLAPALGDDERVASISDLARWAADGIGSAR
jgi:CRISPR system Cascade subunit CasC